MLRAFLIQPLRPEFTRIRDAVASAAASVGIDLVSPDSFFGAPEVAYERIAKEIREVDVVIADITGPNANVMYELGLTQGFSRPLVLITTDPIVPFDVRSMSVIHYAGNTDVGIAHFEQALSTELALVLENPEAWVRRLQGRPDAKRVFVSYSHADARVVERLMVHLKPLEREGLLDAWTDTRIEAGGKWKEEIASALDSAAAAILVVTADFLASEFIVTNELPPLLRSASERGTLIVPLIVSACRYLRDPMLQGLQAINDPVRPLAALRPYEQEALLDEVAATVERTLR